MNTEMAESAFYGLRGYEVIIIAVLFLHCSSRQDSEESMCEVATNIFAL